MKTIFLLAIAMIISGANYTYGQTLPIPESRINKAFHGRDETFVIIDCASGLIRDFCPTASSEQLPPCLTLKVWNTLIGPEIGVISSAEEALYKMR